MKDVYLWFQGDVERRREGKLLMERGQGLGGQPSSGQAFLRVWGPSRRESGISHGFLPVSSGLVLVFTVWLGTLDLSLVRLYRDFN